MNVGDVVRVKLDGNLSPEDIVLNGKTGTVVRLSAENLFNADGTPKDHTVFVQVEGQPEPLWFAPSELEPMVHSDPLVDAVNRLTAMLEKVLDSLSRGR